MTQDEDGRVTEPAVKAAARRRPWWRRLLRALIVYAVTPYVAVLVIFAVGQRWLLYPSDRTGELAAAKVSTSEARVSDVVIPATGGVTLHGWHFAATDPDSDPLLVIYFPSNAGSRQDRTHDCREFVRLGFDVLICDYRGYGDNDGSPSESALAGDAREVWSYAIDELGRSPQQIVLFGESLGGAVAVRLAAELTSAGTPPGGLVLNSTFAALPETVAWHYPAFPFQFVLLDRYPSVECIAEVDCPLLQFHGTDDEFVPLAHGRRLFDAAPAESSHRIPKRFVMIAGGTHNAIPVTELAEELAEWRRRIAVE